MTFVPYLLYLFLVGLHVVVLRDLTGLYTFELNLPAFIVMAVALYKEDVPATWFGFAVGLVLAAGGPPAALGWQALVMAVLALVACYVRERLNLDALKAKILLVFGGVLTHNIIVLVIGGGDGFLVNLLTVALAGAVYTTILAWLFFLIKERRITFQRVKAWF